MVGPLGSNAAKNWLVKVKILFAETQNQLCGAVIIDRCRLADAA